MKWIAIDPFFCVKILCIKIVEFSLFQMFITHAISHYKKLRKNYTTQKDLREIYERIVNSIYFLLSFNEKFFGKLIPRYLVIKPVTVNVDVPHSVE